MCAEEEQKQQEEQRDDLPEIHIQFSEADSIRFRYQLQNVTPDHLMVAGKRLLVLAEMGIQDEHRAKQVAAMQRQQELAKVAQVIRGTKH